LSGFYQSFEMNSGDPCVFNRGNNELEIMAISKCRVQLDMAIAVES